MKKKFQDIYENRNTPQGRVDISAAFINIFLLLCHIYFMIVYFIIGNMTMIIFNILATILCIMFLISPIKYLKRMVFITFIEIFFHMVFAVLNFGWDAGYQNWTFGLVCAFFLPSFSPVGNAEKKRVPIISAALFMITYFVLLSMIKIFDYKVVTILNEKMSSFLFVGNTLLSFVTIGAFTGFYTSRSNRRQNELSRRADYDELTSLYNRFALNSVAIGTIMQASIANRPYSVAILDIDFFKKVNDTYGHSAGDDVLKEVANIMRSFSVKGIVPGRWGGEEFLMIAPNTIDYDDFTINLEKLREKIESTKFLINNKKEIDITISIGSASLNGVPTLEKAVSIADENLYKAKRTGRNKLVK